MNGLKIGLCFSMLKIRGGDGRKGLGVIMQSDLKWGKQCSTAVNTASRISGMIKRSFCYLNKQVILKLCKSYSSTTF